MRPRKVVLLINDREQERNCWTLVFESTCKFRVISEGAMPWEFHEEPEIAVLRGPGIDRNIRLLRQLMPRVRILVITDSHDIHADRKLPSTANMYELMDALRTLAVRKHGPKKWDFEPAALPVTSSVLLGVTENVQ